VDGHGNIILAESYEHHICKITPQGQLLILAGTGEQGLQAAGAWRWGFRAAGVKRGFGVAVDEDGNVIVADGLNNCIHKITPQGQVTTLAGTGVSG
jgi:hypothetical protein